MNGILEIMISSPCTRNEKIILSRGERPISKAGSGARCGLHYKAI